MSIQRISLLTMVIVAAAALEGKHDPKNKCSKFDGSYDCPNYEVLETTDEYDLREYDDSFWAVTMTGSFMDLFGYIQGQNNESLKIPMTAPVFMPQRFTIGADGSYSMNGGSTGMMFYINTENMDVVPEPDNDAVDIDELPKFKAFVRSYGGFSRQSKVRSNVQAVWDALSDDERATVTHVFVAGYDSPWTFWRRHTEVLLIQGSHLMGA